MIFRELFRSLLLLLINILACRIVNGETVPNNIHKPPASPLDEIRLYDGLANSDEKARSDVEHFILTKTEIHGKEGRKKSSRRTSGSTPARDDEFQVVKIPRFVMIFTTTTQAINEEIFLYILTLHMIDFFRVLFPSDLGFRSVRLSFANKKKKRRSNRLQQRPVSQHQEEYYQLLNIVGDVTMRYTSAELSDDFIPDSLAEFFDSEDSLKEVISSLKGSGINVTSSIRYDAVAQNIFGVAVISPPGGGTDTTAGRALFLPSGFVILALIFIFVLISGLLGGVFLYQWRGVGRSKHEVSTRTKSSPDFDQEKYPDYAASISFKEKSSITCISPKAALCVMEAGEDDLNSMNMFLSPIQKRKHRRINHDNPTDSINQFIPTQHNQKMEKDTIISGITPPLNESTVVHIETPPLCDLSPRDESSDIRYSLNSMIGSRVCLPPQICCNSEPTCNLSGTATIPPNATVSPTPSEGRESEIKYFDIETRACLY